jgi:hypothetical protein
VANGGGNSVTEINAATGALIRVISAARYHLNEPLAIATVGNTVWVLDNDDVSNSAVTEINAATGALIRVITDGRYQLNGAGAIAASGSTVWVANSANSDGGGSVTEINAATGALIRVITASRYRLNEPMGIATSGNTAWVADKDSVTEINAATGALIRVLSGSRYPFSGLREIAASGDTVWTAASPFASGPVTTATTATTFTMAEINAATGALVRTGSARLPQFGLAMAADRFGAWLLTNDIEGKMGGEPDGEVAEFSVTTGALIRTLSQQALKNSSGNGGGIAADGSHVWVTGAGSDSDGWLAEFNAATGALIREIIAHGR